MVSPFSLPSSLVPPGGYASVATTTTLTATSIQTESHLAKTQARTWTLRVAGQRLLPIVTPLVKFRAWEVLEWSPRCLSNNHMASLVPFHLSHPPALPRSQVMAASLPLVSVQLGPRLRLSRQISISLLVLQRLHHPVRVRHRPILNPQLIQARNLPASTLTTPPTPHIMPVLLLVSTPEVQVLMTLDTRHPDLPLRSMGRSKVHLPGAAASSYHPRRRGRQWRRDYMWLMNRIRAVPAQTARCINIWMVDDWMFQ